MRKKIIFIDVDGPLAWGSWGDGKVTIAESQKPFTIPYAWDIADCEALQKICDETNAELVVSSDWKAHFNFNELKQIFKHYGINQPIDITTHMDSRGMGIWNKMSSPSSQYDRANQILKWVKDNKISNWISIDDMELDKEYKWMKPRQPMWRHVQVNGDFGYGGRLRDKIGECINKLNR